MIGCSGHTLLEWVKKAEVNSGKRAGVSTELADRLKALEREHRELRQANEILRKASAYRRGPWRSFEAVEYATLEWVDWFNNRRLLAPIGNIPPAEAEERYYAMLDDTPMAA
jgi:transposase InsO family protein